MESENRHSYQYTYLLVLEIATIIIIGWIARSLSTGKRFPALVQFDVPFRASISDQKFYIVVVMSPAVKYVEYTIAYRKFHRQTFARCCRVFWGNRNSRSSESSLFPSSFELVSDYHGRLSIEQSDILRKYDLPWLAGLLAKPRLRCSSAKYGLVLANSRLIR